MKGPRAGAEFDFHLEGSGDGFVLASVLEAGLPDCHGQGDQGGGLGQRRADGRWTR